MDTTEDKKFIVLHGITHNNNFFTKNVKGDDQTKLITGEVAYTVIGYANTVREAQHIIHTYH